MSTPQTKAQTIHEPTREAAPPPGTERNRRGGRKPKPRFPRIYLFTIAALGLLVLLLVFSHAQVVSELKTLKEDRLKVEQEHREHVHYIASKREKSGYLDIIRRYADENSLPVSFVSAVILCESAYRHDAMSRVGARGLMQLMEDTGEWIASKLKLQDYTYKDLDDPSINIQFGTWYLAYLSDRFQGNPIMIASAYHAGVSNVSLWALKFADDERTLRLDQIPKEDTRNYVRKVMDAYACYNEYDQTR